MKLDLLTNATVVDDAIRFVSDRSNDRQVIAMNMMARKNQMSLTIIKTKLEEEQEDETGTDEVVLLTTNIVF
jgi:hypothetical protein